MLTVTASKVCSDDTYESQTDEQFRIPIEMISEKKVRKMTRTERQTKTLCEFGTER